MQKKKQTIYKVKLIKMNRLFNSNMKKLKKHNQKNDSRV